MYEEAKRSGEVLRAVREQTLQNTTIEDEQELDRNQQQHQPEEDLTTFLEAEQQIRIQLDPQSPDASVYGDTPYVLDEQVPEYIEVGTL